MHSFPSLNKSEEAKYTYLREKLCQNKQLTTKFDKLAQIANILRSHYNSCQSTLVLILLFLFFQILSQNR